MKKIITLLACIMMLACVMIFTACDQSTEPDSNKTSSETTATTSKETTTDHIHTFGKWTTVKEATCTEPGEQTRTCSSCQTTDIQTIPANHTWKDSTCTAPKTCTACGATEGNPSSHDWQEATHHKPKTCAGCGLTEGEPLVPGVSIGGVYVQLNSVAGAEPYIYWKNDSGKIIKYVTFTAVPYNAVNDIVASSIGNKTEVNLKVTGPIGPAGEDFAERGNYYFVNNEKYVCNCQPDDGQSIYYWGDNYNKVYLPESEYKNIYRTDSWDAVWYNGSIRKVVVTKIYVEYMDGTTETINDPIINNFYFHD